jgi:putative inorganic carbon (hco3(-)) transporter
MSKTTLVWVLIYTSGFVTTFFVPAYGTFTYLFEYYLRPSLHWWGEPLPPWRYNFIISTALTFAYLMHRPNMRKLVDAHRGPAGMLVGMAVLMAFVTPMAVDPSRSWDLLTQYLKFLLFFGLIVGTLRSEEHFDLFILVHLLGAGWWGWEVYVDPKREQGRLYNIGSGDTLGDNKAASHLLTVIPFVLMYALMHKDKRLRGAAIVVMPLIVNAVILCNSRGATVGMVAALAMALLITKSGHRLRSIALAVGMAGLFYVLADPEFIERQQTIRNYETDTSATGRLQSWSGGMALVRDYPLGAGGGGYDRLSPIYVPDVVLAYDGAQRAPHNTVVLVASEWGIPGLGLYLGFFLACFRILAQVRRTCPEGGIWYYRSVAIQMGLVGTFASGLFSDRFYAEAPFWMGALATVLHRLNADRLAKQAEAPAPTEERKRTADVHPATAHIAAAQSGSL